MRVGSRLTGWLAALLLLCQVIWGGTAAAQSFEGLVRQADASVGRIMTKQRRGISTGSGFVLSRSPDGRGWFYLTNHHVISGAQQIQVVFQLDDARYGYDGRIVASSPALDLAVVFLATDSSNDDHRPEQLAIGAHLVRKGQTVAAVGFPGTADTLGAGFSDPNFLDSTLTTGTVSKLLEANWGSGGGTFGIIQHTAAINPGNSGGPLLDECAQVRGLNTATATFVNDDGVAANDTYWALSSLEISQFLDRERIPYREGASACSSGGGTPVTPYVLAGLGMAALAGGLGFYRVRHRNGTGGGAAPRGRSRKAAASAGGDASAVLELRFDGGFAHGLSAEALRRGVVVGRGAEADIQIDNASISRRHAEFRIDGRRLLVTDLDSTNGTTLSGRALPNGKAVQINTSADLRLGAVQVDLRRPRSAT